MERKKYPEYVTTDSDLWNSADEAYFYVVKKKAKPLTTIITPIIDNALETGLLREATKEEIEEYLLEQDIEKKLREGRFKPGRNYGETKQNYFNWKESNDKTKEIVNKNKEVLKNLSNNDNKIEISETGKKKLDEIDKKYKLDEIDKDITASTNLEELKKIKSDSEEKDLKEEIKPISPTQNAINQKPSVSTKSF
jgi:uncharacterized membrane protein YgaE (UPF0421/DUF939 family)